MGSELKQKRGFDEEIVFESIEFEFVYFKYGNQQSTDLTKKQLIDKQIKNKKNKKYEFNLLIDEKIRFEAGKNYGICGRNESGKTTLIEILCKLRMPQFMQCRMNDCISFDLISRIELRKQICYISQKPFLFEGSIGENIHCSNPNASIDEVANAANLGGVFLSIQSEKINQQKNKKKKKKKKTGEKKKKKKKKKS